MSMIYYTTIKQAEHLVKLGLDPETADMHYPMLFGRAIDGGSKRLSDFPSTIKPIGIEDLPCWSIGALSNVIYKFVIHEYGLKGWVGMYVCSISEFTTYYANDADVVHEEKGKTLLEAVYNMVRYLLEQGYIKKRKL